MPTHPEGITMNAAQTTLFDGGPSLATTDMMDYLRMQARALRVGAIYTADGRLAEVVDQPAG